MLLSQNFFEFIGLYIYKFVTRYKIILKL